jgi:hypothetical protein
MTHKKKQQQPRRKSKKQINDLLIGPQSKGHMESGQESQGIGGGMGKIK